MSLGPIATIKESSPVTSTPLLLVEVTFQPNTAAATTLYLSSNDVTYNGNHYLPRLLKADDLATQLGADSGIDWPPNISFEIADPDSTIYTGWELPYGFMGATVVVRFVFWQFGTTNFSDDSMIKFGGRCNAPGITESSMQVSAISKLNMSQNSLPSLQVQKLCSWNFPQTAAQRQVSADSNDSPSWECGYSPDATGGNAVGNLAASTTASASMGMLDATMTIGSITGTLPAVPFPANIDSECVYVSAVAGSTWTISRAGQGTLATTHSSGAAVKIAYTSCSKDRASCMLRLGKISDTSIAADGNITKDNSNRPTGRFSGILYSPPTSSINRSYITGKWEEIVNSSNEAKYGDLVPLCYGTTWVDPLILDVFGTSDFTTIEVLCCYGQVEYVQNVIVNGVRIPHTYNDTQLSGVPSELPGNHDIAGGWWAAVQNGQRNGNVNTVTQGGDPHGSLCVLMIQVPKQLASSDSIPRVSVQLSAGRLRVYSSPTSFVLQYSDNLVWVLRDVLNWAQWDASELDLQSFINMAAKKATQITYNTMYGYDSNTIADPITGVQVPYADCAVSLTLRQRQSAGDIVRSLRNYGDLILSPNYDTGLLGLTAKGTLADQQPAPLQLNGTDVSNDNTPIVSPKLDGTASTGYVAYSFDESNIARKPGGKNGELGPSTLFITQKPISNSPNAVGANFMNAENQYNQDSLTVYDTESITLVNQEVKGNFPILGPNTFDRIRRPLNRFQAETYRGNPRVASTGSPIGNAGGTITAQWETSVKGITLKVGDIVKLNYQQRGIANWLMRISAVALTRNAERIKLTATYHNELWYLYTFGQTDMPIYTTDYRQPQNRPPYVWSPASVFPGAGDALYTATDGTFALTEELSLAQDTTQIINLNIEGSAPINFPQSSTAPPYLNPIATTTTTGGTIPGGVTVYVAVCAKDVTGATYIPSAPSPMARVNIPVGTNTNTVTIAIPFWPPATPGYVVFAGRSPNKMVYQQDVDSSMPTTITLASLAESSWAMPDTQFSMLDPTMRTLAHAGVVGAQVLSVTSSTITLALNAAFTVPTNMFAGRVISLVGIVDPTTNPFTALQSGVLPVFNANIASNVNNVFTLAAGLDGTVPDPTGVIRGDGTLGILTGDTMIIRMQPTYVSDANGNGMQETLWSNPFALGVGLPISGVSSFTLPGRPPHIPVRHLVKFTTSTPHLLSSGKTVYIANITGMTGGSPPFFPGAWTVLKVIDAYSFIINLAFSAVSSYISGGDIYAYTGLYPNSLQGCTARAIAGTGRGTSVTISLNTTDTIYIVGDWPVPPDSTTVWVIEAAASTYSFESVAIFNGNPTSTVNTSPQITNFAGQMIGVLVLTETTSGLKSAISNSPYRDMFIYGGGGQVAQVKIEADGTATIPAGVTQVLVDATAGSFTLTIPDPPSLIRPMAIARKDTSANVVTIQHFTNTNTIQGSASIALDNSNLKAVTIAQALPTSSKILSFYGLTGSTGTNYTIYDPRFYGGDPTGVADSSAAISSAIAAGGLELPYGTIFSYTWAGISAAFGAVVDGFQIYGGGTLQLRSGSTPALTFAGAAIIKLNGVIIDGNGQTGTDPVIQLTSATNVYMTGLIVMGGGSNPNFDQSGTCTYDITSCHGLVTQTGLI